MGQEIKLWNGQIKLEKNDRQVGQLADTLDNTVALFNKLETSKIRKTQQYNYFKSKLHNKMLV